MQAAARSEPLKEFPEPKRTSFPIKVYVDKHGRKLQRTRAGSPGEKFSNTMKLFVVAKKELLGVF